MLATSALGAALAFTTAPAMAQDATQQATQPVMTQPAPTTTPTTTTTTAPPAAATTDPAPTTDTTTAATTEAPARSTTSAATRTRTASSSAAAAAAARRAEAQSLARTLAARSAAKSAAASSTPAPAATAAPATQTPPPATAAAPAPQASKPAPTGSNDTALEIGGGALALLALGGAAYAITRRRKSDEEEWADEDVAYHDEHAAEPVAAEPMELDRPVEAPTVAVAPVAGTIAASTPRHDPVRDERSGMLAPPMSAFAWSAAEPRHDNASEPATAGDDRHEGESWVERAKRGPTPDNPSLSLKKRLKRAAFFDQRERDVAEGNAVPVDADAGLPENLEEHA